MTNEKRLIDANEAKRRIIAFATGCHSEVLTVDSVIMMLNQSDTVDAVEVVHGRWVHCNGKSNLWHCSVCGEKILYNPTRRTYNIEKRPVYEVNKHCRCCGAKMDGGNEDG